MNKAGERLGGATLFELVLVLLLLSLGLFTLLPRLDGTGHVSLQVQAEQFRRDVSRVQFLASSQGTRLRLAVEDGAYAVHCVAPTACAGDAVADPETGAPFQVQLGQGAVFAASSALDFDGLGRPVDGAALVAATTTFVLSRGGHVAQVQVLPLTGFAQVATP